MRAVKKGIVLVALMLASALLSLLDVLDAPAAALAAEREARAGASETARCADVAALDGTFVQLTTAAATRPREEWERLFADLAALGIEEIFLQWTSADGVAFYEASAASNASGADDAACGSDAPSTGGAAGASDQLAARHAVGTPGGAVDLVLELAERHGQRVWLGLAHDAGWWAGIDRARPANEVEVFLARRRLANLAVARALAARAARTPAFAGWYVPDEVDDKNWLGEERGSLLATYLTQLADGLRELVPGAPVAVSGFAQGWATPEQLAHLWSAAASRAGLSLVLLQDGVGVRKLTLEDLEVYLPPLRAALAGTTARLGVVVELFTERTGEGGAEAKTFVAVPAPLERIERQLAVARRFATGPLVAFSAPDYMSPFGGAEAERLFEDYRALRERCASSR